MSSAIAGVVMNRLPAAGSDSPAAVSPKHQSKSWAGGTELRSRRHREVQLQRVGEQEHPVDGRATCEVDEGQGVELLAQCARPVVEHVEDRNVVGDREREVHVRVTIAGVYCKRPHDGGGDHALVTLRELHYALSKRIPLLDGEHDR